MRWTYLFMNNLFSWQEVDDNDRRKESHLVAGLVRRMALPGCWCASSQSHHRDPAGNHTEKSPHQTYSSLHRETQQNLVYLNETIITDEENWFIWMRRRFLSDPMQKTLDSYLFGVFRACQRLSSLASHQESELQQSSLKASQDHLWLDHQSLQLIIWAHHRSLGTNMCELAARGRT